MRCNHLTPAKIVLTFGLLGSVLLIAAAQAATDCQKAAGSVDSSRTLDNVKQLRTQAQFDRAKQLIEAVLNREPDNFRALYNKSLVLSDQGSLRDAEQVLQQAIGVQTACAGNTGFKTDYSVYNTLGWLQMLQGQYQNAEATFKTALGYQGKVSDLTLRRTQSNLGSLYLSTGQLDKAGPYIKQAADAGSTTAKSNLAALNSAQRIYDSNKKQVTLGK